MIFFLCVVLAIGSTLFFMSQQVNEALELNYAAGEIVECSFELNILTSEYLLHQEERIRSQWYLRYDSISNWLTELESRNPEDQSILDNIYQNQEGSKNIFSQLIASYEEQEPSEEESSLKGILATQLSVKLQDIVSDASILSDAAQERLITVTQTFSLLVTIGVIIIAVTMIANSFLIINSIAKPIAKLHEGVETITSGNLDYKVGTSAKDEIGQLSREFDRMTLSLSKDITERKKVEEEKNKLLHEYGERVKELSCLTGISKLVENPRISIKQIIQGTINLLVPAFQYPDITCARIVFEGKEFKTKNFKETGWKLQAEIKVDRKRVGKIEVYYLKEKPTIDEGAFLKEEMNLIDSVAETMGIMIKQKKAEEGLYESEEKYRTLTENINIGIYRNTPGSEGKFLEMNPALIKMFGYEDKGKLLAMNVADLYLNPEDRKKFNEKMLRDGIVVNEELRLKKKDSTPFWASVTAVAVPDEKGEIKYYDGTIADITERKRMEVQLRDYTKNLELLVKERTKDLQAREATLRKQNIRLHKLDEMKSRFISTATHELRTPLVSIKGYTELIRSGRMGKVPKKIDEMFKVVERNANRLSKLTDDLLMQQRLESGRLEINPEQLQLQELLKDVVEEFQPFISKRNQVLNVQVPADLSEVMVDRTRVGQVIINLLSNASKFTPSEGNISIKARETGKMVEVQVSDNGTGIAKEDIPKLFNPFPDIPKPSITESSVGLGLSICKGIIALHGGKIWAESEGKDKGATFTFTIPKKGETE